MLILPNKWSEQLLRQPETGMGYQVVTITTRDGKRYPETIVNGGFVTRVRGYDVIPFSIDDISQIEVTHEKWDWSDERPAS